MMTCLFALLLLAALPMASDPSLSSITSTRYLATLVLYVAASLLAYTSATVVTSLTAAAASCCDEDSQETASDSTAPDPRLRRGRALGGFRSRGQLGRAIGPLLVSSVYWTMGPTVAYAGMGACMAVIWALAREPAREEVARKKALKAE